MPVDGLVDNCPRSFRGQVVLYGVDVCVRRVNGSLKNMAIKGTEGNKWTTVEAMGRPDLSYSHRDSACSCNGS